MLDARFSRLYFCQSLHTLQRGLAAIAHLIVILYIHLYSLQNMEAHANKAGTSKNTTNE